MQYIYREKHSRTYQGQRGEMVKTSYAVEVNCKIAIFSQLFIAVPEEKIDKDTITKEGEMIMRESK